MSTDKMRYFSTKFTVKMMGNRYIPSVCYPLDDTIEPAVKKLMENDEARMYSEKVRFVNGQPLPIKKKGAFATVVETEDSGRRGRRSKKDFD